MSVLATAAAAAVMLTLLAYPLSASARNAPASPATALYVAPDGNDAWDGSAPKHGRGSAGPFATVQHAIATARAGGPKTILLRGGVYSLSAPITLTPADSGLTLAPYGAEHPLLSGGVRLTGWKQVATGRWEVTLPDVAAGRWYPQQLYVNGARRYRPRLPKAGYYSVASEAEPTPAAAGKGFDRFRFAPGDIHADWYDLPDVEVLPFLVWTMSRFRIAAADGAANMVTTAGRTAGTASYSRIARGSRYLVENVREALSTPGEWYLDRKTGVLTYLSRPDEDPNRDEVVAPRLTTLLQTVGDAAVHHTVYHVTLRGLTFAHAAWEMPPSGQSASQADINTGAALELAGTQDCTLADCTVRNTGAYGISLSKGTQRCSITHCMLYDLGAGGVKIGETSNETDDSLRTGYNTIQDCLITQGGRIHPAGVGVWIGHSDHNLIAGNKISDLYYTGVSVGWSWGYHPSGAHHNTIAHNRIERIGQGVLSDMGGIYTLGVSPGTVLDGNVISDVHSFDYGGWGIYFDEGSTGIAARNNVAYDCKSAPFHQHYGTENLLENNILALGEQAQLMRTRADNNGPTPELKAAKSFTVRGNIIYWQSGTLLGSNWSGTNFGLERNLYWNAAPSHVVNFPGAATLAEWQAKGFDASSMVADPLFADPLRGDFSLRAGSPAERIGFTPIDTRVAAARAPHLPVRDANVPRAFPPPPPPRPTADDFEALGVGDNPGGGPLVVNEEADAPAARVRVTATTAATGTKSLIVTDAPGQKHEYDPHLYYRVSLNAGRAAGHFALRWEKGAVLYYEWRDDAGPYHVGPSLAIDAVGNLSAGGRVLTELPAGRWVRFDIVCGLGQEANGTYDLTVRFPGRTAPQKFTGLKCGPDFRQLRWVGWVSNGTQAATFYLDDLEVKPLP